MLTYVDGLPHFGQFTCAWNESLACERSHVSHIHESRRASASHILQCVAVCCSVLQCVAVCVAVCCSVLQCVAASRTGTSHVAHLGVISCIYF